ncbi:hypothetical protein [Actinospica robiniae]|uniref:hypothetical protein n=1 Tax=Actinospica robiniae TaxID=304901 RepID=UPI0012FAD8C0|nr:hypothetical protein [Actinospica robiniae]
MTRRRIACTGAALVAAFALAGCSSPKSSSGGSTATPAGSPSAAPAAPAVPAAQLTGTQLTAARLTSSDVPVAGFTVEAGSSDSGGSLTTVHASLAPGTMSCADLQNSIGGGGFGETAWSTNGLIDSVSKEILTESVYQFADADAAEAFYTTIKARTNSDACRTVTIKTQGFSTTLTVTVTPARSGVGQQDFANTQIGVANSKPTALATTVALDGPDVLMVGADKQGQSTVPTDVDTGSLLAKLITKVAAAG